MDHEFVERILRLFAMFPYDMNDTLLWRVDGKWAPITFMVNCNDDFWWATSDCEVITPDNIELLEQSIRDAVDTAGDPRDAYWGVLLFCARIRGMRPQGAAYPEKAALQELLNSAGPERPVEFGNPKSIPTPT